MRRELRESRHNGTRFAPGNGKVRDEELEQLKRELAQMKLEGDILKKALAFCVPKPG